MARSPSVGFAHRIRNLPVRAMSERAMLIDELRAIQREHGYLPAAALRALSERARIPLYDVHGVASFYPHFRLTAPPAVDVRVCADMSCHLRGADELSRSLEAHLAGRELSGVVVRPVSCLRQRDRAPARSITEHSPHRVLEGMLRAGMVTGARTGIIYIRHEYEAQAAVLQREIDDCRRRGLLGAGARGGRVPFDVSLFVSPGGYICGEESALLEALEGKRAEPRNKPPFPGTHGLWQKPTVINNVETFALVPLILTTGAEAFKRLGRGGAAGPKFVGVSGHVERPGVYEIAMGTRAREVIVERAGGVLDGRALKAFAPSGASSGYLPASMVDVPLDFKSLQQAGSMLGSGAIVVCADGTCMLDMALNAVRFFKNESCGKCVPCRVGSAKLVDILSEIAHGRGHAEHLETIDQLSEAMALTSICGLGQVAPAPIKSVITHFPEEIEVHVARQRCPSGVCPMA